jgi:hypothetical protein
VLSSEEILNHNKARKTRKRDKAKAINSSKEKNNKEVKEQQQLQKKKKFPEPIIYDPDKDQRNIRLVGDNNSFKQDQERVIREAKEITNYYLELHKNLINTYNSINSQILQNISNSSWDSFFTISGRFTDYPSYDIKNMYTSLISNRDKSLKLIDNIITNNLDTFIKSIKLIQKFYNDVIESYLNCIKKS